MNNMDIRNNQFLSIEQLQNQYLKQQKASKNDIPTQTGLSFDEILQKQQTAQSGMTAQNARLRFSKHASNRLSDRNIELTTNQLERLNDGMKKAGEKGIKDSLVLVDELAFIVNTKSSTVITAMNQTEADENVFTNIDGAVIC